MDSATASQVVFWRALVQLAVLSPVVLVRYRGRIAQPFRDMGWNGVLGAMALAVSYLSGINSLNLTSVGNAMFVISTAPLMTGLLAHVVLKERLKGTTWFAMALATGGVGVMAVAAMDAGQLTGTLVAAVSALTYAIFTVSLRRQRTADMLPLLVLGGVFAAVLALLVSNGVRIPKHDLLITLYLGSIPMALGLFLYTSGARTLNAAELPLIAMVEVVLAPFWVWLFLGETLSPGTILGGVIVLGAVVIQAVAGFRRERVPLGLSAGS